MLGVLRERVAVWVWDGGCCEDGPAGGGGVGAVAFLRHGGFWGGGVPGAGCGVEGEEGRGEGGYL